MKEADYFALANEFIQNIQSVQRAGQQKNIFDGVHGEALVLHCIKERRDEIVPGEISGAMGISSARVAAILSGLENKGLITREIDVRDRRRIIVRLTQKGIDTEAEKKCKYLSLLTKVFEALGEWDASEFVRLTGRLAEVISNFKLQITDKLRIEN